MAWSISSNETNVAALLLEESLYFNGNGYIGVRGNLEEGFPENVQTIRGTYLNGFHDIIPISYGEKLYGFPDTQQKLLNIIDAQSIEIWIGEGKQAEVFSLWTSNILHYERTLHLDKGFTEREAHVQTQHGHELKLNFKRLVSYTTKELFNQYITITPIRSNIPVTIISTLNGNVENFSDSNDPRVASGDGKRLHIHDVSLTQAKESYVEVETYESNLRAAALSSVVVSDPDATYVYDQQDHQVTTSISFTLTKEVTIEKRTFFTDSRHSEDLQATLYAVKDRLEAVSFAKIKQDQKEYMDSFWDHTDITIKGKRLLQEGIRFNVYHLLQSAGKDGISNISAKGLSGEGYEGHYFWDTEIYLLPMFTMTNPQLAKKLLIYRYHILDYARSRAREMGHTQGALFPWRTISGGECSPFFPAGSAQYHISADIAYSYIQYYLATDDISFIEDAGAEVLIETARLWIDTGHFSNGTFKIDAVTGPDEYTCIVNNNYYTNSMAKHNLKWAVKFSQALKENAPEKWKTLRKKLAVKDEELDIFLQASAQMYLPVDETLQINPQDDSFLQKDVWDFKNTPEEKYPLLLHYHPLTLYRYQVCKQADTVLAHFLLEDEQSEHVMKNSYDYYEHVTTHDSSLSSCVFSMMGARVGYIDKAYDYFMETARLDLDNTHGNTKDGLHMANMGGTWLAIVSGFAGLRVKENGIYFRPQLPHQWDGYSFRLQYRGRLLHIELTKNTITINVLSGDSLPIYIWDQIFVGSIENAVHVDF